MSAPDPSRVLVTQDVLESEVASLVDSAPETLDTLSELAEALGNDPNFATTVSTEIGLRAKTADVSTALAGKSDTGHTHTWTQISDAPAYSKDATGDNLVQRSANGHINVPAGAGPQNAPRRSEVDAALAGKVTVSGATTTLWSGSQSAYDALPAATRNAIGFVAVII